MKDTTTARVTGAAYLALAVTGALGFLVIRSALLVDGDAAATLENLTRQSALAHGGVALEVLIVVTQALAAWGFYALFHRDQPVAAFGVAAFGMANAVVILVSAVAMSTALALIEASGDTAATVGLLYGLSSACWTVGGVFFGLWLIPMGWFILATRRMPRVLGWLLVAGGAAYVLGTVIAVASPELASISDLLSLFATASELWIVGYLLTRGIRPSSTAASS